LSPLRVRVEVEITSPARGTEETFTAEGMVCQNGYTKAVGQAVCRADGGKTYIGAFTGAAWSPRPPSDPNHKEDLCYFYYSGESLLVPCTFILDKLDCADGETPIETASCEAFTKPA
ncbi:unnamed protein product, partial [Didymodactylos carnosus]